MRTKTGPFDLLVGHDVVALIGVLADWRLDENKVRHLLLDPLAQFALRQIGVGKTDIVRLVFQFIEMVEAVEENAR